MHLPSGTKRAIMLPAIAMGLAFLSVPSAVADGTRPKMTVVATHFLASETSRLVTTCTGQDGTYRELRQTWSGPSIQDLPVGDTTMTGTLFVRSKLLWKIPTVGSTFSGTFSGTAYVISAATNTVTVVGKFLGAADAPFAGGVYEALVNGPNPASNGKLIGNFDIFLDGIDLTTGDPTHFVGTLGGTGSTEHPAVVVQGGCEHHDDDIMEEVD